jgi:hypothetical protein
MEIEKRTRERRGEEVTRCQATLAVRGRVVELANGDDHGESLMICCCLTFYDNGDRSN